MLHPSNTLISWGEYDLNSMFNIIEIGKPPAEAPYTLKQEILPNRKSRIISTVNSTNDFTITVDAGVVNRESFNLFKEDFKNGSLFNLSIKNATTGDIIAKYSKAILTSDSMLEGITDGTGTNAIITFNCINEY